MNMSGAERLKKSKERKKQLNRERAQRHYQKKKELLEDENKAKTNLSFPNRTSKKRALDRVYEALPKTPEKKAKIVETLLESTTTKSFIVVENLKTQKLSESTTAVLEDARNVISELKSKRSNDSRVAMNIGISMLCGENVIKGSLEKDVASALGISKRRIAMSLQHRTNAMRLTTPWSVIERKTRKDAVSEEYRKLAHDFWYSPGISRPTGNKRDVMRERLGPKEFFEHEKYIMEKTQTEVYQDFKRLYPDIKIGQRCFEGCKPFFVVPVRPKDRNSCCCRSHVEIQMLFKSCMEHRKRAVLPDGVKLYSNLSDLVTDTLCPLGDSETFHKKCCFDRQCKACGTSKLTRLDEEIRGNGNIVKWQRFQYVVMGDTRKLQIVNKETPVSDMFQYFLELLESFPSHQFRAQWQNIQMKMLIDNLPDNHACCVHDYSENYKCQHQDQVQSLYFGQTQVSIHVTILHRHAVDADGEDAPSIVTEHLFILSPDVKHDSHSVHRCRELVAKYLKDLGCKVDVMHEWTDGCSGQYKSRHCMGDISKSLPDFGFATIRNFFETSHAKGPQVGAGANLKHKCDMAVIKREVVIQNAKDMYEYASKEFTEPSPSRYQSQNVKFKRRVYFYVDDIERNRPSRQFHEVTGNRGIHSILGESPNGKVLKVRSLSCYCSKCIVHNYSKCENSKYVMAWKEQEMVPERSNGDQRVTRSSFVEQNIGIADMTTKDSVVAIASGDCGVDYYLFKVTGDCPEILQRTVTDDWGAQYRAGAKVIRGNFFEKLPSNENRLVYNLISNKLAFAYAATVRFICQDTEPVNGQYFISFKRHEDILGALNGF